MIELVVVLAILSALTLVAVRSFGPVQDRLRFEETQRALAEIEAAILGNPAVPGSASGALFSGFVADTGRLPLPGATQDTALQELLFLPAGMGPCGFSPAPGDDQVMLAAGWRGPYLSLPPMVTRVLDGWGYPIEVDTSSGWRLLSRGPDRSVDSDDLSVTLFDPTRHINRYGAEIAVSVAVGSATLDSFATPKVVVYAYAPDPTTGLATDVHHVETETSHDGVFDFHFSPAESDFSRPGALTTGPRTFRAYLNDASVALDQLRADSDTRKSLALHVVLGPGAQRISDLVIP